MSEIAILSTIYLEKYLKKKKPRCEMFLATMIRDRDESMPMDDNLPDEIKDVLENFSDVMLAKLLDRIPPKHVVDHKIELLLDSKSYALRSYQLSQIELIELKQKLEELVNMGYMRPLHFSYGTSMLFEWKTNGELWMCVEYWALNKQAIKNKYPFLLMDDCFNHLSDAIYFTKLNLK